MYIIPRVSAHVVRLTLGYALLALQAANRDGYNTPRVSAHIVRLALGCVLLAFQAAMETGYNVHTSPRRPERAKALI